MTDVDGGGGSREGHGMDGSREEQMRGKMCLREQPSLTGP